MAIMAKVSLIVPAYKAEPWIDECLASIHEQTYKDIEIIVIEDPERTGAASSRNRGLAKATGEYVAFSDADDYLSPDAIERMVAAMEGVEMVCGSFRKFGQFDRIVTHPTAVLTRREVAYYVMGNLSHPDTNQMITSCWAKLYRRVLIDKFPLQNTSEGMAFNFKYLKMCENVRFIDSVVYHNRRHGGSLSTTFDPKNKFGLFGFLQSQRYVRTFLEEFFEEAALDEAMDKFKVYQSMLYFMRICDSEGSKAREVFNMLYPDNGS